MKPLTIAASLILGAVALHAASPQQAQSANAKADPAAQSAPLVPASQPATVVDSPLVRAAKASHQSRMKASTVITNDTLVRTGGHFTTTNAQQPVPIVQGGPKPQTEVEWLAEMRKKASDAATAAAAAKKADELKKLAAARTAQLMEGDTPEGILNDPPPLEGIQPTTPATQMQPMKPTAPPTMETKPPS
jgi:hypothetical protein